VNGQQACAWNVLEGVEGECVPIYVSDRFAVFTSVRNDCPKIPWLIPSSSNHLGNTFGTLIVTAICFALFLACFRSPSHHSWSHKLKGIPCSASMVSEYFTWNGLEDDGFGGVPVEPIDGASGGGSGTTPGTENTWCPKFTWPPQRWQFSLILDGITFCLFALALFIDRWFQTPRKDGTEMESEIIWGELQLLYGSGGSLSGPPKHGYDCSSNSNIEMLTFLEPGQCSIIKGIGIFAYILGLIYLLLLGLRLYICMYASIRNTALVAYRYKRSHRGMARKNRKVGKCGFGIHAWLIRSFLQFRYIRFYISLFILLPLTSWRFLTINNALSKIQPSEVYISWILLLFLSIGELGSVILEARALDNILTIQDDRIEERRRRGAYVAEDNEQEEDTDEYGRPYSHPNSRPPVNHDLEAHRSQAPTRPARHLLRPTDDLIREHLADSEQQGGFGRLSEEDRDEDSHWARSDLEEDRATARAIETSNNAKQNGRKGNALYESKDDDPDEHKQHHLAVLPQHAPIYSSYAGPSSILPPPTSSHLHPPRPAATTSAQVELSQLGRPSRASAAYDSEDDHPLVLEDHTTYNPTLEDQEDENETIDL
jgi:hypothetical protein